MDAVIEMRAKEAVVMVKPAEKPKAKPKAGNEVNDAREVEKARKKPPPAKPYIIKRTWL